jgi:hypothetical protein
MYKHNFGNCTANWAGVDIKNGLDVGLSITAVRTSADWTMKPIGNGKIVQIKQTDLSGAMTCTIDYSAPTYVSLMAQRVLETVSLFTLYDGDTGRTWYFNNAFITNEPDLSLGIETGPFSFVWFYESSDFQAGAPSNINLNVVGS